MHVDEAGGDDQAVDLQTRRRGRSVVEPPDLGNAFAGNADVGEAGRAAGAVNHRSTGDDEVEGHKVSPS